MNETDLLRHARDAIRAGNKAIGRHFLQQALAINPQSEIGWLWMSSVVEDPQEQHKCLERVLEINPGNEKAKRGLAIVNAHMTRARQLVPISAARDRQGQLDRIHRLLVDGEVLHAVYDLRGGNGFVVVTDLRVVFTDQGLVRKNRTIVSLPYARITAVGAKDSGRPVSVSSFGANVFSVSTGGREWSLEFRTDLEAYQAHQTLVQHLLRAES
jgi:hypothetical protein